MTKLNFRSLVIAFAVTAAMLTTVSRAEQPPAEPAQKVGAMNNAFATDLFHQLSDQPSNVFFSPTSIETALAMTWAGARGQTAQQMAQVMHLPNDPAAADEFGAFQKQLNDDGKKGGYELAMANALWGIKGYPFQPAYLNLVETKFGGHLSQLDFANNPEGSRQTINDWVAGQTHDKIKDLIPQNAITPTTRLVLTNAIYFKGKWDFPFKKAQTQDQDFHITSDKTSKVPMMTQHRHFGCAEDAAVQVLELPYGNNDLAMRIFLPRNPDGLAAFEQSLTTDRVNALTAKMRQEDVIVSVPRFKVESSFEMSQVLQKMGMKLPFDAGQADFSGMTTAERFFIGLVVHKAYVNVDEEGTEAAAATGITLGATAARPFAPPKVFRADHPFLFTIVHQKTGGILFLGRVVNPSGV